jgi:adenylosuccinate lyase
VQKNAMETWTRLGTPEGKSFRENLDADPEVAGRVPPQVLDEAMDARMHLKALDALYERVFGEAGPQG